MCSRILYYSFWGTRCVLADENATSGKFAQSLCIKFALVYISRFRYISRRVFCYVFAFV